MRIRTLVRHILILGKVEDLIEEIITQDNFVHSSPLIPLLQMIQEKQGYLSVETLKLVSEKTGASLSRVYGVATFYHQFRLRPEGKHRISICRGTACHVTGAHDIYNVILNELGITPPEDTSNDGLFTVHEVRCLGACSLAPILKVNDTVYGKITPKKLRSIIGQYKEDKK
jgi:NADH:ubiquinone oxidoreductase subunit E